MNFFYKNFTITVIQTKGQIYIENTLKSSIVFCNQPLAAYCPTAIAKA